MRKLLWIVFAALTLSGCGYNEFQSKDEQVKALFERVKKEQGRLDILVNNAFSLPEDLTEPKPFWKKPLSNWEMVDVGVRP